MVSVDVDMQKRQKYYFDEDGGTIVISAAVYHISVDSRNTVGFYSDVEESTRWGHVKLAYRPSEIQDFQVDHIFKVAKRALNPKWGTRIFTPYSLKELKLIKKKK